MSGAARRPPVAVLVIFDGWGLRAERVANAIAMARTPTMDHLYKTQAHTEIEASGEAVDKYEAGCRRSDESAGAHRSTSRPR